MEMFLALLPMVYIFFQLIRFARVCSNVDDFNNRNLFLTAKLLKQGYSARTYVVFLGPVGFFEESKRLF